MFKNIEYDLLNISKQMEDLSLPVQVELFVNENKQNFVKPIMPAYGDGQVDSEEKSIGYKVGTTYTLMEETLLCIESAQFNWMHENKVVSIKLRTALCCGTRWPEYGRSCVGNSSREEAVTIWLISSR
jgi:hypothetical protein